jgi:Tol biopolymer transport system component
VPRFWITLLAVASLAGSAGAGTTTQPGANGRLLVEMRSGFSVVEPRVGGATAIRVPGTNSSDRSPTWSPDGTRIAFVSFRKGDGEIYVMNGDGSGVKELTFSLATDDDPAWAPDGGRIAFESYRTGDAEIWIMRSDGGSQRQLTSSRGFDGDPAFSPDGSQIAFTSMRDGNREIYVMDADGSGQRRLTFTGGIVNAPEFESVDQNPAWSPDGSSIYFDSTRDGNLEIYVMRADGSGQTRLTDSPGLDAVPVPSPDGRQILFASDREERDARRMWIMNADGKSARRVTGFQSAQGDWQRLARRPAACSIWGTNGNDLIPGTRRADRICGLGGNDTILARDRTPDVVDGGPGRDRATLDRRLDRVRSVEVRRY